MCPVPPMTIAAFEDKCPTPEDPGELLTKRGQRSSCGEDGREEKSQRRQN